MPNNRGLVCFVLASGIILWCAYRTLLPATTRNNNTLMYPTLSIDK